MATVSWYIRKCAEDPDFRRTYNDRNKERARIRKERDPVSFNAKSSARWTRRYREDENFRARNVEAARRYRARKKMLSKPLKECVITPE
jgi:hypothetical protein